MDDMDRYGDIVSQLNVGMPVTKDIINYISELRTTAARRAKSSHDYLFALITILKNANPTEDFSLISGELNSVSISNKAIAYVQDIEEALDFASGP